MPDPPDIAAIRKEATKMKHLADFVKDTEASASSDETWLIEQVLALCAEVERLRQENALLQAMNAARLASELDPKPGQYHIYEGNSTLLTDLSKRCGGKPEEPPK